MKEQSTGKRTLFEANNLILHLEAQIRKKDKELASANACWTAIEEYGLTKAGFVGLRNHYNNQIQGLQKIINERESDMIKLLDLLEKVK